MSEIARIAAAALLLAVLYVLLKETQPAYALLLAAAGCAGMLLLAAAGGARLLSWLQALQGTADSEAFACLIKAAAILLLTEYTRSLCRDAGLTAMGCCVEFCGRCLVLTAAFPMLSRVYQTVWGLAAA